MWTVARWLGAVLIVGAAGIQLIRPARTNPPTDPSRTLASAAGVPHETAAVLERACRDCHSNETRWPWYSNVAPISWLVIDHVNHGRRHFNYSEWAKYERTEKERLLKALCTLPRQGEMPMPSYAWMHRDATLADADVLALCGWVEAQQRAKPSR
jgi:hypothetical protein